MDERTQKLIDTYKRQGPLTTGQIGDVIATTPVSTLPTTINSSSLSSNEQPFTLPEITTGNSVGNLSAVTNTAKENQRQKTQLEKEAETRALEAQTKANEQESKIRSLQEKITGVKDERASLQEKQNIAGKTQKVTDYTNELEALERAETNELRALDTANMTAVGSASAQAGIRRQYAFQKADVALLQSAANRDLLTAQSIIDSQIKARLEPLESALTYETAFLERNWDLLDEADKQAFQVKITADERDYKTAENFESTRSSLLMQAVGEGATPDVIKAINGAKNQSELFAIPNISTYLKSKEQKLKEQLLGIQIQTEVDKAKAVTDANKSGVLTGDKAKLADDLRGEYNGLAEVKDAKDLESNVTSLLLALEKNDGVSDISAINTFQRLVVDPGVAVREGDVALLQSAMSFTDRQTLRAKGLMVGDKLTPVAREQMKSLARGVYEARVAIVESQTSPIRTRASESGIEFGKYIGNDFMTLQDIDGRIKASDPVNTILDSYADDLDSNEYVLGEGFQWLNSLQLN